MTRTFSPPFPTGQATSPNPLLGRRCGFSGHGETRYTALPQMLQKRRIGGSAVPICARLPELADILGLWGKYQWGRSEGATVGDCDGRIINLHMKYYIDLTTFYLKGIRNN